MAEFLSTPLQYLKGVGPRRAADLRRAGLETVEDLLYRFPLRYEDRAHLQPIAGVKPGTVTTIAGEILSSNVRTTRRAGFKLFEALVRDRSGSIRVVWPNQAFLRDVLQPHQQVVLFGAIEVRGGLQMTNPEYEIIRRAFPDAADPDAADEGDDTIHTGRIVPVYEKTGSVTTRMQRQLVHGALQRLPADVSDPLPAAVRAKRGLPDRGRALADAHFPPAGTPIETLNRFRSAAQVRLIFEEFFLFQLGLVLRKRRAEEEHKPHAIVVDDRVRESARRVLPFRLTSGQKQALKAIVDDMQRPQPMNRLLQGDVGAGKTIVALLASLVAMENGLQAAFMAPTEILAEQHYANLVRLLAGARFRVALLTGTLTATARREVYNEIASGAVHLVVGTHALVQDPVTFHALGLAVIDEQHRFGVLQRAGLRGKGLQPDVLVMTATPIPRTLALTTYGDMDVSVIPDLPPGRHPITTIAKPEGRREEVHAFVRGELEAGRQAYIIYPLVEESEKVDLKAATEMADTLQQEVFQAYRVALLHGRMKPDAKDRVMAAFARGELHVLVATTVVEVGVDVPNAAVMIVEHAERFGLSQLHQLRGRVGRGPHRSHCILLYQHPLSEPARDRLKAMTETTDGFEIAERDLAQRGPGDFFGTRQSGVPTLRVGDLLRDHQLMEDARREAVAALDAGDARELIGLVTGTWEKRFGLAGVG